MLKVYDVTEQHIEKLNKTVKKVVIQKEGLQYPFQGVTVWPELDIFAQVVPGYQIPAGYEIDEKDGTNINPKSGKPYKQRTLVKGTNTNGTEKSSLSPSDAVEVRLARLEAKVFGQQSVDDQFEAITSEDIPF